ncbi:uncharacterized protein LOC133905070 [Phragmites australis]|uniref:uncharacterized protein LOC133905070 n=1 Tax=Phragmites australis TaxID=29695 RepID=UPI002D76E158|nr:uncharacterized protein LOC133905070 [Phragmites australis]
MVRSPFRVAMEGGGRALWLALLVSWIAVSFNGEAAMASDAQPATAGAGQDTNVLCVSKCGTCPTVCSSPPPPSEGGYPPPSSAKGGSGSYSSPSAPPSPPGQGKGGRPSSYYYFFTAGSSRTSCAGSSIYVLVFLVLVSLAANFQ